MYIKDYTYTYTYAIAVNLLALNWYDNFVRLFSIKIVY